MVDNRGVQYGCGRRPARKAAKSRDKALHVFKNLLGVGQEPALFVHPKQAELQTSQHSEIQRRYIFLTWNAPDLRSLRCFVMYFPIASKSFVCVAGTPPT